MMVLVVVAVVVMLEVVLGDGTCGGGRGDCARGGTR